MKKISEHIFLIVKGRGVKPLPKTLFSSFLKEQVDQYEEPERRGTPKGEPIGIFRDKFNAALCMLTRIPQKEIAEKLGISHGVLRKWNTEEQFKDLVQGFCGKFVDKVYKQVEDIIERHMKQGKTISERREDYAEFSDSAIYGRCILEGIQHKVRSIFLNLRGDISEEDLEKAFRLQKMLVTLFFNPDTFLGKWDKKVEKRLVQDMVDQLRHIYPYKSKKEETEFLISRIRGYIDKA